MHKVHFLAAVESCSTKGWVAPVELPFDEPQDGVLVVPVSDRGAGLFAQYQLEFTIYRGSGKYGSFACTMDLLANGLLSANVEGHDVRFLKHVVDGRPVVFDYIGQLSHADFAFPLCQIEPEDDAALDDLYERKQIFIAGCEPESAYGGFAPFLRSSIGQKKFRY